MQVDQIVAELLARGDINDETTLELNRMLEDWRQNKLDPADASNGATEVFPGYHLQGCMTPRDGMYHRLPDEAVDLSKGVMLDLAAGDIAIFGGFTPHRSGANRSSRWRRLLYLSYNAMSDGGDRRDRHYREFHTWLQDRYAEYGRTSTFFR